jgi:acyl-CoA synthetase (AMP-forming)/AMP-acid ligase II
MSHNLLFTQAARFIQIVDDIPHNPAGKILKTEVRKLYGQA